MVEVQEKSWWYIYILDLYNHNCKNKSYYNHIRIYYTGITEDIGQRLGDYIYHRGLGFINTKWRNARLIPIFITYLLGTREDAEKRERTIKSMTRESKEELIASDRNVLLGYKPLKHLILKNTSNTGEIIEKIH